MPGWGDRTLGRRDVLRGLGTAGALATGSGLLTACGGLAGSQGGGTTGGTTIKIAYISPQTGPLAGFTEPDGYLLDLVRKTYAKGVQVGGTTYQYELVIVGNALAPHVKVTGDIKPLPTPA